MVASGGIERTEKSMFQLLLQQIMVVLEVPKIESFKKYSFFWYFSCTCEVTSKVLQGLQQNFFYRKNKKVLLNHL